MARSSQSSLLNDITRHPGVTLCIFASACAFLALVLIAPALAAGGAAVFLGAMLWIGRQRRNGTILSTQQRSSLWALYAALASTPVWRIRTSGDLASNPLDTAGVLRFVLLGVAALFAAAVVLPSWRRPPLSLRLYGFYIAVCTLGMTVAVNAGLVGFRVFELGVCWFVALALWKSFGQSQVPLLTVMRLLALLAALAIVTIPLSPSTALIPTHGGILPWRLEGVFPNQAANSIGTYGLFFVAYGLARRSRFALVSGVSLVLVTQYRTGYVILMVLVAAWLLLERRAWAKVALAGVVVLMPYFIASPEFQQAWLRGEDAQRLSTLNSRTEFWERSVDVARRSPIIGVGLSSGSRYEVLAQLTDKNIDKLSSVHGTWPEAFLGSGVLGITLLAGALLVGWRRSMQLWRSSGDKLPLLLLTVIAIRSVTGSTIELASTTSLLFLTCLLAAALDPLRRTQRDTRTTTHEPTIDAVIT